MSSLGAAVERGTLPLTVTCTYLVISVEIFYPPQLERYYDINGVKKFTLADITSWKVEFDAGMCGILCPYTLVVTLVLDTVGLSLVFFTFFPPLVLSVRHVLFVPEDKQTQAVHSLTALQINSQPKSSNSEHVADMWPGSRHLLLLLLGHSGGSASAGLDVGRMAAITSPLGR